MPASATNDLTPAQMAFLVSLLPGPRATNDCPDAIAIGGLVRRNLVSWEMPAKRTGWRRPLQERFALSASAHRLLAEQTSDRTAAK